MSSMMLSNLERGLGHYLRTLASENACRYSKYAEERLSRALFRHLSNNGTHLELLFPQGPPDDDREPWCLSKAQGAVDGAEYLETARGRRCGHIFKSGEATYSCRTCTADDTCVLCTKCFDATDHEGHQVYVSMSPGANGCCDCGDPEAWTRPVVCSIHTTLDETSGPGRQDAETSQLPPDLQFSIRATISMVLDFMCDVLSCCPEEMKSPKSEDAIRQDEEKSRLRERPYGGPDEKEHEFALVLWNDEKHTVDEVAKKVEKACRNTRRFGMEKASEVNDVGRSILEYSTDIQALLRKARILGEIRVTVTIRSARDTFREQMCETIIEWLADIAGCSVGTNHHILMNVICEEMLKSWRIGSEAFNLRIAKHGIVDQQRSDNRLLYRQRRILEVQQRAILAARRARPPVPVDLRDDTGRRIGTVTEEDIALPLIHVLTEEEDDIDDDGMDEDDDLIFGEDEEMTNNDMNAALGIATDFSDGEEGNDSDEGNEGDDIGPDEMFEGTVEDAVDAMFGLVPPPNVQDRPNDESDGEQSAFVSESDTGRLFAAIPQTPGQITPRLPQTPGQILCLPGSAAPSYWTNKRGLPRETRGSNKLPVHENLNKRIRMDHLILYDLRMWKRMRNNLKHLYITTVVTIPEFKRILSLRFAAVYSHLAQLYLIADREPDHSVINLSLQMLTTPSITAEIVKRGNFYTRLLAILYTFLTKRQVGNPEDVDTMATISFETGVMTNRRIYHFFHDMKYLLDAPYVKDKIREEDDYLLQFLDFVKLYQGICPNIRAVGDHIEYESDAWISASIVVKDITRISRQFCESFKWTRGQDPARICRAIRQTAKITITNSLGIEMERFTQAELKKETEFKEVTGFEFEAQALVPDGTSNISHFIVQFEVESAPMSFHHPLHYTLSWLIDSGKSMSNDQLAGLLSFTPQQLQSQDLRTSGKSIPPFSASQSLLALFDIPLRVCAWLAQMRAGMWVRNGITLRHQMGTFRGVGQREVSYQRDIFLLQVAFVVCNPATFLATVIDRFGLTEWIKGNFKVQQGFDDHQMVDVAEDFAHLLIVLLSDRTLLVPPEEDSAPDVAITKRDIIHVLCFKPLTFSELTARLSDRVQELENFQEILHEVTEYRPPEGLSDSGLLQLKDECYMEIDPYHAFYSRSQREEAENVIRARMAKKSGRLVEDTFFEPKLRPIHTGIFSRLPAFSQLPLFGQTIFSLLRYVLWADAYKPHLSSGRAEALLQTTLHLALSAVVEDGMESHLSKSFTYLALNVRVNISPSDEPHRFVSILWILFMLLKLELYQTSKPRVRHLLNCMQQRWPESFREALLQPGIPNEWATLMKAPGSATTDEAARKKKQALDRQAKVMASFKKQQNDFIEQQTIDWGVDEPDDSDQDPNMMDEDQAVKTWAFPSGTCIFCQEETNEQHLYGTLAFVAETNLFRQTNISDENYVREACIVPCSLDHEVDNIRPFGVAGQNTNHATTSTATGDTDSKQRRGLGEGFPASHHQKGPVVTGCGHLMHYSCFQTYDDATARRHTFQIARQHPENTKLKEFVCPLCKALGNAFLPVIWKTKAFADPPTPDETFDIWLVNDVGKDEFVRATFSKGKQVVASCSTTTPMLSGASRIGPRPFVRYDNFYEAHAPAHTLFLTELRQAYERLNTTLEKNELQSAVRPRIRGGLSHTDVLARSLGFSVASVEIAQRGIDASAPGRFPESIPEQVTSSLKVLSETVLSYLTVAFTDQRRGGETRETALIYTSAQAQTLLLGRNAGSHSNMMPPLFSQDVFIFFAEFSVFSDVFAPQLKVQHLLRLCYLAEIVKVIMTILLEPDAPWQLAETELMHGEYQSAALPSTSRESQYVSVFIEHMLSLCRRASSQSVKEFPKLWIDANPNRRYQFDQLVLHLLGKYALQFLRKAALLLHVRHGVDFSSTSLRQQGSQPELFRLSEMLGLPSMEQIFESFVSTTPTTTSFLHLSGVWISDWYQSHLPPLPGSREIAQPLRLSHPGIYELVALPYAHDTLNAEAMSRRCPTKGRELFDPAVCLFCGTFVCSQSPCCTTPHPKYNQVGGCFQHREKCGGNVGMFLNIRKCTVLMLHRDAGSYFPAPYLDKHGEVDMGLKRKNQLFLNQRRYDRLFRDVWLGHGVPSAVARKLEAEVNTGGWETI